MLRCLNAGGLCSIQGIPCKIRIFSSRYFLQSILLRHLTSMHWIRSSSYQHLLLHYDRSTFYNIFGSHLSCVRPFVAMTSVMKAAVGALLLLSTSCAFGRMMLQEGPTRVSRFTIKPQVSLYPTLIVYRKMSACVIVVCLVIIAVGLNPWPTSHYFFPSSQVVITRFY